MNHSDSAERATVRSMSLVPPRPSLLLFRLSLAAALLVSSAAPAIAAEATMAPMPGMPMSTPAPRKSTVPTPLPSTAATMAPMPGMSPMPARGMDMSSMRYNANGVMSMYGMTKSGMHMDMSTLDPTTMSSVTDVGTPMTREGS